MTKSVEVIISNNIIPRPENHEIDVAWILARHFQSTVEFLKPSSAYKMKTADIVLNGIIWEIKSPTGNSTRTTIKRQFKGLKQSRNLIIYTARTKLDDKLILQQINREKEFHRVGKIIVIIKDKSVLEIL